MKTYGEYFSFLIDDKYLSNYYYCVIRQRIELMRHLYDDYMDMNWLSSLTLKARENVKSQDQTSIETNICTKENLADVTDTSFYLEA